MWLAVPATISSKLNRAAAIVAALLLALMTSLILVEIVLRYFSRSTFMADALVGNGVAAITFLAMGWAIESGSMIRVRLLHNAVGRRTRWFLEFFAIIVTLALMLFLFRYQWKAFARDWSRGTVSEHYLPIPLWIPDSFFLIGILLVALHLVVRLLRLLAGRFVDADDLKI